MLKVRPTSRAIGVLIVAALIAAAGFILGTKPLVTAAAVVAALLICALLLVAVPRRSGTVKRRFTPALPKVGEAVTIEVLAPQTSVRTFAGAWQERMPPALAPAAGGAIHANRRTQHIIAARFTREASARGQWTVPPVELTTGDAFGFFTRRTALGAPHTVLIAPAVEQLAGVPGASAPHLQNSDRSSHMASVHGSDSLTPRDYVPGDSMRRVHWRASAHRGQLMVRQEDRLESPETVVVLNLNATAGPAFERAVSACASVAGHLEASDWRITVTDTAGTELSGPDLNLLRTLAMVNSDAAAPAVPLPQPRGASVIYIAAALEHTDAERLFPPADGIGIALVTILSDDIAEILRAHGWRLGSTSESVRSGWDAALEADR